MNNSNELARMIPRRVVITGAGLVTPLGCGLEEIWSRILLGHSGLSRIVEKVDDFNSYPSKITIAGFVPRGDDSLDFNALRDLSNMKTSWKQSAISTQFALLAAQKALKSAAFDPTTSSSYPRPRIGVSIGSGGIGPLNEIVDGQLSINQSHNKLSPYFVPKVLSNMAAGNVSIEYGFQGPVHSVSTACAAGTHSIGDAFNYIRWGQADMMIAGATEASISPLSISGFARMRALSQHRDHSASRPFDKSRDGFVMSEGAGIVILEDLASAIRRNAPIISEIRGYANTGDAFHQTSPSPVVGGGAQRCMRLALADAGLQPSDIGYINAHATSTPIGDAVETEAIDLVFAGDRKNPLHVSSTKGATGHLLGAAGAVETIFTALALRDKHLPPTINLDIVDPVPATFRHVPNNSISGVTVTYALKNSFGFGGVNGVLVLGAMDNYH